MKPEYMLHEETLETARREIAIRGWPELPYISAVVDCMLGCT